MKNLSRKIVPALVQGFLSSTGTADVYSSQVDMANYDGCLFHGVYGTTATSTGTATFSVVGTNTSTAASTAYSAINGASVTVSASTAGTTGKYASIDLWLSKYRYLKAKLARTAGVRWQGTLASKYASRYEPTSPSTATLSSTSANVLVVAAT
jgi:hypothetical protein